MGEGFAPGSSADLIAELEAILPKLRRRLDDYLDRGAHDIIAADEGFNFAGQIQPLLSELAEHAVAPGSSCSTCDGRAVNHSLLPNFCPSDQRKLTLADWTLAAACLRGADTSLAGRSDERRRISKSGGALPLASETRC